MKIGSGENVIKCVITGVDQQLPGISDQDVDVRYEVMDQQKIIMVSWAERIDEHLDRSDPLHGTISAE